jgi:hypothetical protein
MFTYADIALRSLTLALVGGGDDDEGGGAGDY